jgi:putative transposase
MSRYRRSLVPGATYFFTLTLANRPDTLLTGQIERLRNAYTKVHQGLPFQTVAICILPDHLHAIWALPPEDKDFSLRWQLIKRNFSSGLKASETRTQSKIGKREKGIWQRRFWEHQIRDDMDLRKHVDYIHFNPVKHGLVERVAQWPHSSFHRYVARGELPSDWGGGAMDSQGRYGE